MTLFEQAQEILKNSTRYELRDHAFGDCEVIWENEKQGGVGYGYFSGSSSDVSVLIGKTREEFYLDEAKALRKLGRLKVERNDETGPDIYQEGKIMPGLTLAGVYKELTDNEFPKETSTGASEGDER